MSKIVYLIILVLPLNACYTNKTYLVSSDSMESIDKLNKAAKKREMQIELSNQQLIAGKTVYVTPDSTSWYDETLNSRKSIPTSAIKKISIKKRNTARGLGLGFLTGASIGFIVGMVAFAGTDCTGGDWCIPQTGGAVIVAGLFSLPGSLIGSIDGAGTETTINYEFQAIEDR